MNITQGTYTQAHTVTSVSGVQHFNHYTPGTKILVGKVTEGRLCTFIMLDDTMLDMQLYSGVTIPLCTKGCKFEDTVGSGETLTIIESVDIVDKWKPDMLSSSLHAWYDPSDSDSLNFSNGLLSSVDDKTSNNNTLYTSVGRSMPTIGNVTQNGLNVFEFDVSANPLLDSLESDQFSHDLSNDGPLAFSLVLKDDKPTDRQSFIVTFGEDVSSVNERIWLRHQTSGNIDLRNDGEAIDTDTIMDPWNDDLAHLITVMFDGVNTQIRFDGNRVTPSHTKNFNINNITSLNIGTNEREQQSINGFVGEVMFYKDVTSNTVETVEGYLAHKWGVHENLPQDHAHKTQSPVVY